MLLFVWCLVVLGGVVCVIGRCCLFGGFGVDGVGGWLGCVVFVCGCVVLFVGVCGVKRSDITPHR